jgi:hypothetical protein
MYLLSLVMLWIRNHRHHPLLIPRKENRPSKMGW